MSVKSSRTHVGSETLVDMFLDYENPYELDRHEFIVINKAANHYLASQMMEHGEGYWLPKHAGRISIRKAPMTTKRFIDFKHYNNTGEKRFLTNKHTEGYYVRWLYQARNFPKAKFIQFYPSRNNKRVLAKRLKNGDLGKKL